MLTQAPKGTHDVLPGQIEAWQKIESEARDICARHGYSEIRTPVFEHTELFLRGVGDTTDVVQKEMYTFLDKGGRSITLKPEGTAGAVRAFIEGGLAEKPMPLKLYYLNCPVFRYENPQAGRLREHHQFGIEYFGAPLPECDAEIIALEHELLSRVGLKNYRLKINSIGCPKCRPVYQQKLRAFLEEKLPGLCPTCQGRFEKNPLRILDCKEPACQKLLEGAPEATDNLCPECDGHFKQLQGLLDGLGIEYDIDTRLVRGLDYYTKTVFEFVVEIDGAYLTVCGGGRYDGLVKTIGGPEINGAGFGMGIERLLFFLEKQGVELPGQASPRVYIASFPETRAKALKIALGLRREGISCEMDTIGRSLKAQFKYANRIGARYTAVLGQDEDAAGQIKLRNMQKSEETLIMQAELQNAVQ